MYNRSWPCAESQASPSHDPSNSNTWWTRAFAVVSVELHPWVAPASNSSGIHGDLRKEWRRGSSIPPHQRFDAKVGRPEQRKWRLQASPCGKLVGQALGALGEALLKCSECPEVKRTLRMVLFARAAAMSSCPRLIPFGMINSVKQITVALRTLMRFCHPVPTAHGTDVILGTAAFPSTTKGFVTRSSGQQMLRTRLPNRSFCLGGGKLRQAQAWILVVSAVDSAPGLFASRCATGA
jgi:hypothetical protein